MHTIPSIVGSKITINKLLTLTPETIKMPSVNAAGEFVEIKAPYSHIGNGPIQVRLISSHRRQGMVCIDFFTSVVLLPYLICKYFSFKGGSALE